jgi:hypothetical protein
MPFNIPTKMIVKMPSKMPAKTPSLMLGMPPKTWLVQLVSYHPTMPRQVQVLSLLRAFSRAFLWAFEGHFVGILVSTFSANFSDVKSG